MIRKAFHFFNRCYSAGATHFSAFHSNIRTRLLSSPSFRGCHIRCIDRYRHLQHRIFPTTAPFFGSCFRCCGDIFQQCVSSLREAPTAPTQVGQNRAWAPTYRGSPIDKRSYLRDKARWKRRIQILIRSIPFSNRQYRLKFQTRRGRERLC